jgi:uncharacterized MAPEG superfamily protein
MSELTCLILGLLLWVVHILIQGGFANTALGLPYLAGPRDEKREPNDVYLGRATRALHNYVENFVAFAAADLGLLVTNQSGGWGATLWILARIVYIPLYLLGVPYLRTLAWGVSLVGLLMMIARLAGY